MAAPKILAMRVDMSRGLANNPSLYAVLDTAPADFVFDEYLTGEPPRRGNVTGEMISPAVYVGWNESGEGDWARHYSVTGNQEGCGRGEFVLTMRDGSTKTIKGPWIGAGVIPEHTEHQVVEITWVALDDAGDLEKIWSERGDMLAKMTQIPDKFTWDDAARYRAMDRSHAAEALRRKPHGSDEWEGSEEQISYVAELLLWKGGIAYSNHVKLDVAREALRHFCLGYTLYPFEWKPGEMSPEDPWWVPAPRARLFGGESDIAAPKKEGWWGYAVHDEHGYPRTAFARSVRDLVDGLERHNPELLERIHNGHLLVSGRYEGSWVPISRANQRLIDHAARSLAA